MSLKPARLDDRGLFSPKISLVKNYKNAGKKERQEANVDKLLAEIEAAKKQILESRDLYPDATARRSKEFISKLREIGFEKTAELDFEGGETRRSIGGTDKEADQFFDGCIAPYGDVHWIDGCAAPTIRESPLP